MDEDNTLVPRSDRTRAVTRSEFEEVIRRATELASSEPDTGGGALTEAEVFRIAQEVGLHAKHVERALAQVRGSPPVPQGVSVLWSSPWISASRVVPGARDEVAKRIDDFMVSGRLLHPVRQSAELLVYWPAVDWASQIARAASATGKKYYVASAKRVEVALRPVTEDSTWVELQVDPGIRNDSLGGAVFGGGTLGTFAGIGLGVLLVPAIPLAAGIAVGALAGLAVTGGTTVLVGRSYRAQLEKVRLEIQGILDQLERGEMPEPPPPSWTRWVSRRFRGIAREIARSTDEVFDLKHEHEGRGGRFGGE